MVGREVLEERCKRALVPHSVVAMIEQPVGDITGWAQCLVCDMVLVARNGEYERVGEYVLQYKKPAKVVGGTATVCHYGLYRRK